MEIEKGRSVVNGVKTAQHLITLRRKFYKGGWAGRAKGVNTNCHCAGTGTRAATRRLFWGSDSSGAPGSKAPREKNPRLHKLVRGTNSKPTNSALEMNIQNSLKITLMTS